jgi:drug/metabolite transporter (DMT)-like permease
MTGAITSFSAMAIAVRELKGAHDTFEIMAARSAVGLLIVLVAAWATGRLREVSAQRLGGHVLRNAIHFTGQNLWILAVTLIPLAQVFALEFTTPIWVLLLSPFFLGERITALRLLAAVLGFVGILVVARPDVGGVNLGMAAAAASAVCFALTGITTRMPTKPSTAASKRSAVMRTPRKNGDSSSTQMGVVNSSANTCASGMSVTARIHRFCPVK